MIIRSVLFALIGSCAMSAQAYELDTHATLSLTAARSSVLADPRVRSRIGLTRSINDDKQKFIGSQGGKFIVEDLIRNGARYEDDFPRSIHHFFDPMNNSALHLDLAEFPDADPNDLYWINRNAIDSPSWALGLMCAPDAGCNNYSLRSARDYFFKGLTGLSTVNNTDRLRYMGLTFDTLGRIIHHLQDMAQPQHVRNDGHLHVARIDLFCKLFKDMIDPCRTWDALVRPSGYEEWTNRRSVLSTIPTGGYDPVYAPTDPGADGQSIFASPLFFWMNDGKGIAEFANRNFLSENTMYRRPPVIDFGTRVDVDAGALCAAAVPPCGVQVLPGDIVTFYSSVVDDQFRPATVQHPHAAAVSIFDAEFTRRNPGQYRYTVNRFTFADDHALLLPRAVAYSAGFINYFFRGDMEIAPPPEGVYGIVDTSSAGCRASCGFRKIKLFLKNATPNDDMGAGTLRVVAKYHTNNCYRPDLSGDFDGDNFIGNSCRSPDEYVAVSNPMPVTGVARDFGAQALTFDFPDQGPIPINASDIFLQVVFRGQLGQEDDAVAVTTRDISEPNYYALMNATDLVYDPGIYDTTAGQFGKYFKAGDPGYESYKPIDISNIRVALGANSALTTGTSIATLDKLTGGQYAQFAMLMEHGQTTFSEEFAGPYVSAGEQQAWYTADDFTMDDEGPAAGKYTRSCPVYPLRGRYWIALGFFVQQASSIHAKALATSEVRMISVGNTSPASGDPSAPQRKALPAAYCLTSPSGGVFNFGDKFNLDPNNALVWQVNF